MQRGGTPCAYDRVLSSRLGATAALMISKGEFGNMVAIHDISAPPAMPAFSVSQPALWPMTSTIKTRLWEAAVVWMQSITSVAMPMAATMRGVAKGLYNIYGSGVEIIGFIDGYKGLMYEDYKKLTPIDFTGLLTRGSASASPPYGP